MLDAAQLALDDVAMSTAAVVAHVAGMGDADSAAAAAKRSSVEVLGLFVKVSLPKLEQW